MRRAAFQALRSARRIQNGRRYLDTKSFSTTPINYARRSRLGTLPYAQGQQLSPLQSSLHFRSLAIFVLSSLVASGTWYLYKDAPGEKGLRVNNPSTLVSSTPSSLASFATSSTSTPPSTANAVSTAPEEATESTRKALVVHNDEFFTGEIPSDQPVSKEVDGLGQLVLEMLTPEQATQKLRQNQESFSVRRGRGVVRYDVVQLASNSPIEDDHVEKIVTVPDVSSPSENGEGGSDWSFWGVFDGHSGWTTSAKLRQTLVSFVTRELNDTYKLALANAASKFPSPEAIDAAIKKGFVRLDNEICHESVQKASQMKSKRNAAVELLAPAFSGSCALLSFYDSRTNLLRVACAGDSRAVLGRRGRSGKWTATPLSEDQTGGTPSEDARLRREHPGEEHVTARGRILGSLEPSRAFGDAIYKWSRETAMHVKASFFGKTPSPLLKTPPYVTAEPIVTTTKIEPSDGDFVVMATDGLWECLTNEEVVGLVGQWIDHENSKGSGSGISSWFSSSSTKLPVENHSPDGKRANSGDGQRAPVRQEQWPVDGGDERFVVEDKNAATHLIRNALGGSDRDMVCALLSLPSPYSRRYRDDLTVQVIFFGQANKQGDVVENVEASAPVRPKL